jgi:hypothetical protein
MEKRLMENVWSVEFWNDGESYHKTTPVGFTLIETVEIFNSFSKNYDHVELIEWSKNVILVKDKGYEI